MNDNPTTNLKTAVLGGGCFWCLEAAFKKVPGVVAVKSGYCGGKTESPDYKAVCTGATEHAEVVNIEYDSNTLSFTELLHCFFAMHNPTQLNRQGNDIGTQYRTVIFPQDDEQETIARAFITSDELTSKWDDPIVTTIEPKAEFYPAEDYHDDYFANNPNQPYCQMVVAPKVAKVEEFLKQFEQNRHQ